MRIVSILIAIVVITTLYFFVFERDALIGVATPEATETDMVTGAEAAPQSSAAAADNFAPPAEKQAQDVRAVPVVATKSVAKELDSAVLLRGETQAARSVDVTAETAGRVINEPLRKGAYVNAGQALCHIDPGTRDATQAQARAALAEAEVALTNAERLAKGGYAAETQVLAATAGVEAARAALAQATRDIENLTIKAPFAGLLESDTAELGTVLGAGSVCARVIQLDPIKLVVFAPEAEVNRIEVGALAGARLISGDTVTGRVTFLARSADPATRTFRVEVEIPNPDFAIRDGQTVELAISSAGRAAHLVPQSALTLNDDGNIGLRLVSAENLVEFAPIDVIRDTVDGIWVAGLPEQADIITLGQDYVRAGVKVAPSYEETASAEEDAQ